jgi:MFS family permease
MIWAAIRGPQFIGNKKGRDEMAESSEIGVATSLTGNAPTAKTRLVVFYGWWVVLICALGLFLGPVPTQEFHATRGAVSLALTLNSTIAAFCLPVAGRFVDRFGPRRVILPCTFVAGLFLLSASFCSGKIWQLYLFYSAMGLATCGIASVSYGAVVSHWFDRLRGLALGLMMLGSGLGAFVMPLAAQYLIARSGWRFAFALIGGMILLITLPVVAAFLKERPEPMGLLPDGGRAGFTKARRFDHHSGLNWSEAWRIPSFWVLFTAFVLVSASVHGCFAHIAAILGDRGTRKETAAFATSLFGIGLLVGRSGLGYLLDRFFAPRVAALIFGCAAIGIGLLGISRSQEVAFAAALLIGLGLGAEVDLMAYLTSRYFGLRSFGAIYGFLFAGFALAQGLGAYLMGVAFDAARSYTTALIISSIFTLVSAALMLRVGPYRYQRLRE